MPDAAFEAPLRAALVRAIGIGGLLLAAGLLGAFLLARRLVTSLRAVGEPASAPPLPTGLREVDDLAARLRRIADERDRVQRAVEYQLTLLRAVTESTTEAIFLTDPLGRVTYTNPEAERLTGWSQEELIGQVLHDVLQCRQPDGSTTTPSWASTLADVFRNGESKVGQEEVFFRRDGSAVDVDCSSAPVVVNGRIAGAVMIVRDITTRKRTDKTLRENEARLRDLVHTLDLAALTVHDLDGQITFWMDGGGGGRPAVASVAGDGISDQSRGHECRAGARRPLGWRPGPYLSGRKANRCFGPQGPSARRRWSTAQGDGEPDRRDGSATGRSRPAPSEQ
jgi:PAS domain S-box-containing protein